MSDKPKIRRRLRCPKCSSLDNMKWGIREGVQRYKVNYHPNVLFSFKTLRSSISIFFLIIFLSGAIYDTAAFVLGL